MAHAVVARLKAAGLPDELDTELASLSTDLGDLWGAQKELEDRLESLFGSLQDWGSMGDSLVDLRATVDHIGWHARRARRPARALARFAYAKASKAERAAAGHGKTSETERAAAGYGKTDE
jgi:hypothetical protein